MYDIPSFADLGLASLARAESSLRQPWDDSRPSGHGHRYQSDHSLIRYNPFPNSRHAVVSVVGMLVCIYIYISPITLLWFTLRLGLPVCMYVTRLAWMIIDLS